MTDKLVAHIKKLNEDSKVFKLVEDLDHWAKYGITTVAEFNEFLTREAFSNVYKDRNGVRPRGEYTIEEMKNFLANS